MGTTFRVVEVVLMHGSAAVRIVVGKGNNRLTMI
jgi:hypothetical protein